VLASEDESRALAALRFSLASDIVELVVLTVDELFLQTLREGVGPARRLWHVLSPDKVSDLLVAGGVGILVLDVHALNEGAARFVADIKRQFPDLVVVVAGNREAETELARLISDGSVYRFIHKPMSPARARLFADAAVKRFDDQRRQISEVPAPAATAPSKRRQILIAATVAALVVAAGWLAHRGADQQPAASGNTAEPPASSAAQPFGPPLGYAGSAPAAQGVLMEAQERLLAKARTALDQRRLDDAAATIETARKAGIATERVAQLATELAAARDRAKAAPAAAPAGSAAPSSPSAPTAPAPAPGALPTPSAQAPSAPAASSSAEPSPVAPMASTPTASAPASPAPATPAAAVAVPPTTALPAQGDAARASELTKSARQSIAQDHLVEPEDDNAQYYLVALRKLDPESAGLAELTADLGGRLVAKARASVNARQYEAARDWLVHAAAVGYVSAQADAARHDVDAALERQAFMADVITASQLTLVKSVQPQYPLKAEKSSVEGWVELDFTVTDTGAVEDVAVSAAKPAGVFEAAATAALLQWHYKPLVRDSKAVATRARIRIRFTLAR
jgi:TonB family protein